MNYNNLYNSLKIKHMKNEFNKMTLNLFNKFKKKNLRKDLKENLR